MIKVHCKDHNKALLQSHSIEDKYWFNTSLLVYSNIYVCLCFWCGNVIDLSSYQKHSLTFLLFCL